MPHICWHLKRFWCWFYFGHFIILLCPYKSRTTTFNPTEMRTQSRAHLIWASQRRGEKYTRSRWSICFRSYSCPQVVNQVGFIPITIQVGIGSFSGFTYRSLRSHLKPPVHAHVPLGGQMSNLTPPGLFQYFDISIISCFWRFFLRSLFSIKIR